MLEKVSLWMPSCSSPTVGLEQRLGRAETLRTDGDDLSVGQFVVLLQLRGRLALGHLLVKVERHIAQLLLNVAHNLLLGRGGERVPALRQNLLQSLRYVAAREVEALHCVRQTVALVDGHSAH